MSATDLLDTTQAGSAVIRGGGTRIVGYLVNVVIAVGSSALLLRYLGVADTGRYTTVVALTSIVTGITDAGLATIGIREYSHRAAEDRERMMRALLGLRVTIAAVGLVAAVAFALLAGYDDDMLAGTALAGFSVVILAVQTTWAVPLVATLRLGRQTALETLRWGLTGVGIAVLVLLGSGLVALLGLAVPVTIVTLLATVPLVRGQVPMRPSFEAGAWRNLVRIAGPYAAAAVAYFAYAYIAMVLFQLIGSPEETGIYGAAFRIFITVTLLPALFMQVALPVLTRAARDDQGRFAYASGKLLDVTLIAGGLAIVATVAGAPLAIHLIAGPDFDASIPVLRIQGAAFGMSFLAAYGSFVLLAQHRDRSLGWGSVAALLTTSVLTLVLGSAIGANGTALANLAGETVLAAVYGAALVRGGRAPRPAGRTAPAVVLGTGLAVAVALGSGLPSLLATVLGCAVYGALLLVSGVVPAELRVEAGRLLSRRGSR